MRENPRSGEPVVPRSREPFRKWINFVQVRTGPKRIATETMKPVRLASSLLNCGPWPRIINLNQDWYS